MWEARGLGSPEGRAEEPSERSRLSLLWCRAHREQAVTGRHPERRPHSLFAQIIPSSRPEMHPRQPWEAEVWP